MEQDRTPIWARQDDPDEKARKIKPTAPDGRELAPNEYGPDPFEVFRPDIPSPARMYDYFLGGKDHLPADRKAAERIMAAAPPGFVRAGARLNREFMQRAVRHLVADVGIRQLIDIGAGMPTMGPVHEVAQAIAPESRIVYVDNDPIVIPHCREMLSGVSRATVVHHDLRKPEGILTDPEVRELIDFDRPVAILLIAILHFISDEEDPAGIIRRLIAPFPSGSYIALSHGTGDKHPQAADTAKKVYEKATTTLHFRPKADIRKLLDGFELVDPGLVLVPEWRPDPGTNQLDVDRYPLGYGTVARKP